MSDLFSITFALLFAFIASEISKKLHFPRVIGQLVFSLLLAFPFLKDSFFNESSMEIIQVFSDLGIVFLLFLTGFELNLEQFKRGRRNAAVIAVTAAVIPFGTGVFLAHIFGYDWTTGIVLGACMSVTAEGTKVIVLHELKKMKTYLAGIMLGAGILDDIFEIFFLLFVLGMSHTEEGIPLYAFPLKLIFFIVFVIAAFHLIPRIMKRIQRSHNEISIFHGVLVIGLLIAMISEWVGLGTVSGAFMAGIILQKSFNSVASREKEEHTLHLLLFAFIIPFFFINIGLQFEYMILFENPLLTLSILAAAFSGKILGTLIAKPFVTLSWGQLYLVGWGMNSRGVMELVLAHIALSNGLINQELYSAIVFMTVVTTVSFPFVFRSIIKSYPNIMDDQKNVVSTLTPRFFSR